MFESRESDFLLSTEIADLLAVDSKSLDRWVKLKKSKLLKRFKSGAKIFYRKSDVEKYLQKNHIVPEGMNYKCDVRWGDELLSRKRIADCVGMHYQTLAKWTIHNMPAYAIPYVKVLGSIKYRVKDIEEWVIKHMCNYSHFDAKLRSFNCSNDVLIDQKTAASILNVCPTALYRWRFSKKFVLPYLQIGSMVRYKKSDVMKFIAARNARRL